MVPGCESLLLLIKIENHLPAYEPNYPTPPNFYLMFFLQTVRLSLLKWGIFFFLIFIFFKFALGVYQLTSEQHKIFGLREMINVMSLLNKHLVSDYNCLIYYNIYTSVIE